MSESRPSLPELFHTTHWSMVQAAAENSAEALERLCQTYWRPLYGFARRAGHRPEDAQDMVQGFLAKFLEKRTIRAADESAGTFRGFLQVAFRRYMMDQYDRSVTQKRGGGAPTVVLETTGAEDFFSRELATTETPETAYERAWAFEVIARARAALRAECAAAGREEAHDALQSGEKPAILAERLGMSPSAFHSFAFRLRRRLQQLIRAEILLTVKSRAELEEEVSSLLRALGRD